MVACATEPLPRSMTYDNWKFYVFSRLTARLEDLEEAIRDYWEKEETKLQECMRLREFHEEFKSVSSVGVDVYSQQ